MAAMRTPRALVLLPAFFLAADGGEQCGPRAKAVSPLAEVSRVFVRADSFDYQAGPKTKQLGLSVETGSGVRTSNGSCLVTSRIDVSFAGRDFPFTEDGGSFYDPLCGGSGGGCWACRRPQAEQTLAPRPLQDGTLRMQDGALVRSLTVSGLDVDRGIRLAAGQASLRVPGTLRFDFDSSGLSADPFVQAVASNGASVRAELAPGAILVHVDAAPAGPLPLYVSIDYSLNVVRSDFAETSASGFSVWERQAAVQITP